uniref:uncharacterized protein LOC118555147 isoform X3 n=1 Tax=Halichoerus grypus TaxID=9711 RepID=UPI001659A0FE|nr:uncharacterized protein LOC118555147 isoform X3 [Halichoerus grypus]
MIVIKKDPLARRTRIRLSVLPGLRQGRHRPPGVVLTFTFLSPTDVTALRNSSICRGAQNHLLCGRLRVPDELSQPRKPASTRVRCRPQPPPGQGWGPKRWRGGDPGGSGTESPLLSPALPWPLQIPLVWLKLFTRNGARRKGGRCLWEKESTQADP